ncbi:MAG: A/G-specific adenine glycosylase [Streptococcus sp.]|nr:A/G-specific adenine glycosylase [Streptococcus sp.]
MIDLKQYGIMMWEEKKIISFRKKLLSWYDENARDLPWRQTCNPYHIWISEIMLQQTRVDTVIPYYQRFVKWFPTIIDLADASEEKLLKSWEGLGYYSRVRNMQVAAKQIQNQFDGEFPTSYEEIKKLKGIGPYTAGAIASIAFSLPEPAVDGNVMRVLSRLFEVNLDIGLPKNRKIFQAMMEILIDPIRPGDFNQALMDLGSDIEAPVHPRPEESPVKEFSAAYLHGTMDKYPIKEPKKKPLPVYLYGLVIQDEFGRFLLEKNESKGLLSGFWHFPLIEVEEFAEEQQINLFVHSELKDDLELSPRESFEQDYDVKVHWQSVTFPQIKHVFSHRKWHISLNYGKVSDLEYESKKDVLWLYPHEFETVPFAKPQQKMWETFSNTIKP